MYGRFLCPVQDRRVARLEEKSVQFVWRSEHQAAIESLK
jgi:hypothetical protein